MEGRCFSNTWRYWLSWTPVPSSILVEARASSEPKVLLWMEKVYTVASLAKMERVPSPSCRSRSMIRIGLLKPLARRAATAMATSLKRQNPEPWLTEAWWNPPPRLTATSPRLVARRAARMVPPHIMRWKQRNLSWLLLSRLKPRMGCSAPSSSRECR